MFQTNYRRCDGSGTSDERRTLKIEQLNQWKLEAEFRNFQLGPLPEFHQSPALHNAVACCVCIINQWVHRELLLQHNLSGHWQCLFRSEEPGIDISQIHSTLDA